ncbi:alpha/beta hydrolase family protein [Aureimonas jatrophae]|nr:hypothetical protein [Aureimonas jatrophae]MBB3952541.1 hypothetical protein [Aureimonas jatrophae]
MIQVAVLAAALFLPASARAAEPVDCPEGVPTDAVCHRTQDARGAWLLFAKPANWNGVTILHAHGGPRLSPPKFDDPDEDLTRFSVLVREGYAWAATNYRREGFGVRMAAEDVVSLSEIAPEVLGEARLTILHGQSWGGNVAAKTHELYAIRGDGTKRFDGVVLTSGVLAGGPEPYEFRAGLRAVYQYYCRNHPRPDEPPYELWRGLPEGAPAMKRADLEARVEECTGLSKRPDERTEAEAGRLRDILAASGVPERTLLSHLLFATNTFSDIVNKRLDGRNPFTNEGVRYTGTSDDDALNRGVQRFRADPEGARRLRYDSELTGRIVLPTVTLHAKDDPTAFVSLEQRYRDAVEAAGNGDLLVQHVTDEREHSKLADEGYVRVFGEVVEWVDKRATTELRGSAEHKH